MGNFSDGSQGPNHSSSQINSGFWSVLSKVQQRTTSSSESEGCDGLVPVNDFVGIVDDSLLHQLDHSITEHFGMDAGHDDGADCLKTRRVSCRYPSAGLLRLR